MGEEPPMCFGCDEQILHIEHILLNYSDFIEMRENHFTAQSVHVLFDFFLVEQTFNYLKAKYFLEEFKFPDLFWLCLCFNHFLSLFLNCIDVCFSVYTFFCVLTTF